MKLERLIGTWFTEATHPQMPGVVVHGVATISWLEGQKFVRIHAVTDHPKFPDSTSILGNTAHDRADGPTPPPAWTMHYFDSRGVFRVLDAALDDTAWRLTRLAPGMSQRFTGTFADGGDTIRGLWQMDTDGKGWVDDLVITYRRKRS